MALRLRAPVAHVMCAAAIKTLVAEAQLMLVLLHAVVAAASQLCGLYCAVSSLPTDLTQHVGSAPNQTAQF